MHCKLGCAIRVCAFNLGTQEEMEVISESEVSLVCKASSRTVSTVAQRNSVLKKQKRKKKFTIHCLWILQSLAPSSTDCLSRLFLH